MYEHQETRMRMERFKTPLFPLEFSRVQIVSKGADSEPGSVDESVYREKKILKRQE